jgi:hypothetical protein
MPCIIRASLRDLQLKLNLTATEYECIVRRAQAAGMRPTHYGRAVVLSTNRHYAAFDRLAVHLAAFA